MISFILRLAARAVRIKNLRFLSLTLTMVAASSLLVILSSVYMNAESKLAMDISGVPNMVIQNGGDLLDDNILKVQDIKELKTKRHFWRNNVLNAMPILEAEAVIDGETVHVAGTWFRKEVSIDEERYNFGLLHFDGWKYEGVSSSDANSVILGANIDIDDAIALSIHGRKAEYMVAGMIETGTYWDDYIFMDIEKLKELAERSSIDKILVSALIKPQDELSRKAEQYGVNTLNSEELEKWSCSPYAGSIAYSVGQVLPGNNVRILRRITEVQGGVIKASTGIFFGLFVLTLASSLIAIISAEKMYVTSHLEDFGIMAAIGGSSKKIMLQLLVELGMASFISAAITYMLSALTLNYVSHVIFNIEFSSHQLLIVMSLAIPFLISFSALLFARKGLTNNTTELLR
ncbi:FtsX-like permease family protein [Fodinibius sediminis]|uniref:ABC-type transport system, involved in lipoprotein release, permease component n=1 Tax=Fodinibius sediminis TaxID=1214077 RepID=A0A521D0S3_9BACT|nr:ABC transporter permease [Fodinibius sediminis]SMO64490.1 ABC-type transport system, involved in lipoprotein release, permease component [Fodinibius sediminis]